MASELAARGVPRELAAAALSEVSAEAEVEAARRLVARLGPDPDERELARAASRLRRRGFGESTIRAILRDLEFSPPG